MSYYVFFNQFLLILSRFLFYSVDGLWKVKSKYKTSLPPCLSFWLSFLLLKCMPVTIFSTHLESCQASKMVQEGASCKNSYSLELFSRDSTICLTWI